METETSFTLPRGYVGSDGKAHREGVMRRARAGDEILLLEDPRVKGNKAYLVILLFARVILRLGDLQGDAVSPAVIEGLFSEDLQYLQDLYLRLNGLEGKGEVACPHCGRRFRPALGDLAGGLSALGAGEPAG